MKAKIKSINEVQYNGDVLVSLCGMRADNVESNQVADFDTLEQAKQYCSDECKGYELVCDGDTEYEHGA